MVDLTSTERNFLIRSLWSWDCVASSTQLPIRLLGFADRDEFYAETVRLAASLEAGDPLGETEWGRAVLLAELSFTSIFGAGEDWQYMMRGISDGRGMEILRGIHRKVPEKWAAAAFVAPPATE